MAGDIQNIKVYIPLKPRSGLTGNYHAICHYSYNLPSPDVQAQSSLHFILAKGPKSRKVVTP